MAGLLGNFMTPENLGLLGAASGLLQASGPSRMPVSLGQAMGQGLQGGLLGFQQGTQMQQQDLQHKLAMRKLQKDIEAQEALQGFYTPQTPQTTPQAPTGLSESSAAGLGAPWAAAPQTPPQPPQQKQIPNFGQLLAAGVPAPTVKAMMKDWELKNPNLKWEGGIPMDPRTGTPVSGAMTVPQTNQQGFSTTPRFNPQTGQFEVGVTPGSEDAFRTQQGVAEETKARFDLIPVPDGQGGTVLMPRSAAAQRLGGGQQAPQAPRGQPGGLGYTKPAGSVGEQAVDKGVADDLTSFATGGFADIQKQVGQLREVANALKIAKPGTLTGPAIGMMPRSAMAVMAPNALAALESVEEVAQRNLRLILGAQFTEKEGDKLISRVYNPALGEVENAKRVDRLITQIDEAAKAKLDAAKYFQKHGTLKGWRGKIWTLKDFEPEKSGPKDGPSISPETQKLLDKYAPQ